MQRRGKLASSTIVKLNLGVERASGDGKKELGYEKKTSCVLQ
jgi:hypothetical protein